MLQQQRHCKYENGRCSPDPHRRGDLWRAPDQACAPSRGTRQQQLRNWRESRTVPHAQQFTDVGEAVIAGGKVQDQPITLFA